MYQNNRANEIIRKYQSSGTTQGAGRTPDTAQRVFSPHGQEAVSPRQLDFNRQIVPGTAVGSQMVSYGDQMNIGSTLSKGSSRNPNHLTDIS